MPEEIEKIEEPKKSNLFIWVIILVLLLIVIGGGYYYLSKKDAPKEEIATEAQNTATPQSTPKSWQESGVAVSGAIADPEIIDLGNGTYRLYYSEEPEVQDFQARIFSSTSTDGINWTKEEGIRKTKATFPDIIKLSDGSYRMYFQNSGVIKSATSADGLTWTDEPGVRVDKSGTDFNLDNAGASSTTILPDGTYLMVYRGTINQPYQTSQKIPNNNTQIYFYATSTDGLTFTKKGLSIDSQNETLLGLADGGEWVNWDGSTPTTSDDELRVYFWSYSGVYYAKYENGGFSAPVFEWSNNKDAMVRFASNPPSDPTFIKIGETWFMYYGQHTKGIYISEYK